MVLVTAFTKSASPSMNSIVFPAVMPEVEASLKVLACDEFEVTAAESVVVGMMVCANNREAARSKPQRSDELNRVFFMVVCGERYNKILISGRLLL